MQVFTASPVAVYTGMTQAFRRIASTEGSWRLWRGVSSVILGAGPAHAVYFGVYEIAKEGLGGNGGGQQVLATAGAGAMATIASDALMNPFDGQSRTPCFGSVTGRRHKRKHKKSGLILTTRM